MEYEMLSKGKRKLKHKKHKKNRHSSTSDSEMSGQDEWVEAKSSSNIQRDDWMNTSSFVPTLSKEEIRGRKRKKELQPLSTIEKPGQHTRELNPYWKDGGTGLPVSNSAKPSTGSNSSSEKSIGDGGLNWLRRAYQRIEEQAKEENKSLEEVAAARWGSLEKLESLLREAEAKAKGNKYSDDRNRSTSWKIGSSHEKFFKRNKEQEYSWSKKLHEHKSRKNYNQKNKDGENCFQRPAEIAETATQQRKFCWEDKAKMAPMKQNWMKKDDSTKPIEDDNKASHSHETCDIQIKQVPEEPAEQCQILSDKEMNELGAKLIKAEMLGRKDQAEQLKLKLEAARKAKENAGSENSDDKTVILFKTNDTGFCQPLSNSHYDHHPESSKIKFQEKKNKSRRQQEWLADNDKHSLKQMFEREKMTTSEDGNIEFAKLFAKSGADDDDIDGFLTNNIKEKPSAKQEQHDRSQAIQEHIKMSASLEKCSYCLESNYNKKHLIIAIGIKTYISLPSTQSFTNGHCFIVPMPHTSAGTLLDEDVWAEIKIFQKGLTKMFEDIGKVAIFVETSMHHRRHPHTIIECIPVEKESGDMAPFYFKKAIMESETEWSHNKKLVDLYKKDLLHSVPKGLPYFCVQFGLEGGFAHVIEDEKLFPFNFGKEIIGGLLEMEPMEWRKPRRENPEEQREKTVSFRELWKPYDWTVKLKER